MVKKTLLDLQRAAESAHPRDPLKRKEKFLGELNKLDNAGSSALHLAARYNRKNVINALVENGADINLSGAEGLTPLHLSTKYVFRFF